MTPFAIDCPLFACSFTSKMISSTCIFLTIIHSILGVSQYDWGTSPSFRQRPSTVYYQPPPPTSRSAYDTGLVNWGSTPPGDYGKWLSDGGSQSYPNYGLSSSNHIQEQSMPGYSTYQGTDLSQEPTTFGTTDRALAYDGSTPTRRSTFRMASLNRPPPPPPPPPTTIGSWMNNRYSRGGYSRGDDFQTSNPRSHSYPEYGSSSTYQQYKEPQEDLHYSRSPETYQIESSVNGRPVILTMSYDGTILKQEPKPGYGASRYPTAPAPTTMVSERPYMRQQRRQNPHSYDSNLLADHPYMKLAQAIGRGDMTSEKLSEAFRRMVSENGGTAEGDGGNMLSGLLGGGGNNGRASISEARPYDNMAVPETLRSSVGIPLTRENNEPKPGYSGSRYSYNIPAQSAKPMVSERPYRREQTSPMRRQNTENYNLDHLKDSDYMGLAQAIGRGDMTSEKMAESFRQMASENDGTAPGEGANLLSGLFGGGGGGGNTGRTAISEARSYESMDVPTSLPSRVEIPLTRENNDLFSTITIGTAKPGTNPQVLKVLFDTGSPHLWVVSSKADLGFSLFGGGKECQKFFGTQSSTYVSTSAKHEQTYLSGHLKGYWSKDIVKVGSGVNAIVIPNQAFSEVLDIDGDKMFSNFDAIFGLGIMSPALMQGEPDTPLMTIARHYGKVPLFGIYINRFEKTQTKLVFGDYHDDLVEGEFHRHQVLGDPYKKGEIDGWNVQFDGFHVGKQGERVRMLQDPRWMLAQPDTGTSAITGPPELIDQLYSLIFQGTPIQFTAPEFKFPCNNYDSLKQIFMYLPVVSIVLNGISYGLLPQQYIGLESGFCVGLLRGVEGYHNILLGRVFLTYHYTMFDFQNQAIYIAKAKQKDTFSPALKQGVMRQ